MASQYEDKIGRDDIVDKICALVDNLGDGKNFCLALDGEWGSGKSFVMQMIEEKLSGHKDYIVIKYDAWKNSFYSDPLIAILYCILDELQKKYNISDKKNIALIKKACKKIAKQTGSDAMDIAIDIAVDKIPSLGGKAILCAAAFLVIKNIIQNINCSIVNNELFHDYMSYQTILSECINVLNTLTTDSGKKEGKCKIFNKIIKRSNKKIEKFNKIIILVDEIDRCLPDDQLKILERLHHLFDVKNCAVIVAMNQKCVMEAVGKIYGLNGEDYLNKFFDFYCVLTMSSAEYFERRLQDIISDFSSFKTIGAPIKEIQNSVDIAYRFLLYGYGERHFFDKINNIEITRYFDSLDKILTDFGRENVCGEIIFFVIIALFIHKFILSNFLIESNIIKGEDDVVVSQKTECHDYIGILIGIRRNNFSQNISKGFNLDMLEKYRCSFNNMVYCSIDESKYAERVTKIDTKVNNENCAKLRGLILRYSGDKIYKKKD